MSNAITYGYGLLYNWFAVDTGKLAPSGWHVPSDAELTTLTDYLGGLSVAGGKLKSTRTEPTAQPRWGSPNTGATNETGFNALPGGIRYNYGSFSYLGSYGYWWSCTEYSSTYAWYRKMRYSSGYVGRGNYSKDGGYSVRCIKDDSTWYPGMTVTDIDGNVYGTVKIGTQVWMTSNLKTTSYNDGTEIPNITDGTEWSNLTTGAYCSYDNAAIEEYTSSINAKFDWNARKGTYISESNIVGSVTGSPVFKRRDRGFGLQLESGKSVEFTVSAMDIGNLITWADGDGTLRITCNSTNTDITISGKEFNNDAVNLTGITTITATATSGTVYLHRLLAYGTITTQQANKLEADFLISSMFEYPGRNFDYPDGYLDIEPVIIETFENYAVGETLHNQGTGSFEVKELTSYVNRDLDIGTNVAECTSNGTYELPVDLSEFADNGYIYIDRYDGSSWTRYEDTVSNLSTDESWFDYTDRVVTLTGTSGDQFTNLKIYNGVKQ